MHAKKFRVHRLKQDGSKTNAPAPAVQQCRRAGGNLRGLDQARGSWLEAGKAKANLMQSSLMQRDGWPKRDDGETTRRLAKAARRIGGVQHGTK